MDTELSSALQRWEYLLLKVPGVLEHIDKEQFLLKPAANKWSQQEVLGHLIDSAANNLQRFVRIQFEDTPFILYDQDNWNRYSYYKSMTKEHVVDLWVIINRHLLNISRNIPEKLLQRKSLANAPEPVTLRFLIIDYIAHMEHHLKQILGDDYSSL